MTRTMQRICYLVITVLLFFSTEGYSGDKVGSVTKKQLNTFNNSVTENIDLRWNARALQAKKYLDNHAKQNYTREEALKRSLENAYLNFVRVDHTVDKYSRSRSYTMSINLPDGKGDIEIAFVYLISGLRDRGVLNFVSIQKLPTNVLVQVNNLAGEYVISSTDKPFYRFLENHPLNIEVAD